MRTISLRKVALVAVFALAVVATLAMPAYAQFNNAGFELGTFNSWTKTGGTWDANYSPPVFTWSGDPGKSAIVSTGWDPLLLSASVYEPMVYDGNYAARINNSDNNLHFSVISQSAVWGSPYMSFAWLAVLEDAHPNDPGDAFFNIIVSNLTAHTELYNIKYAAHTIPSDLLHSVYVSGYGDNWSYTDWQKVVIDTSAVEGDTLELVAMAADCGYSAHGGYLYLDVPEPSSLALVGIGLAGLFAARRRMKK